jgi:hypothetical protein
MGANSTNSPLGLAVHLGNSMCHNSRQITEKIQSEQFEKIIEAIPVIWDTASFEELQSVFLEWIQQLTRLSAVAGECFTG